MANQASRLSGDLAKLLRRRSSQLVALKKGWAAVQRQLDDRRELVCKHLPDNDPIYTEIDLLSPLEAQFDENLHTRALAYLLDESKSREHELERSVLIEIVREVKFRAGRGTKSNSEARKILKLLSRQRTEISVFPEYRYAIERARNRSVARCDIWIEVKDEKIGEHGLVIIENKIDAPVTDQLKWYQKESNRWCSAHAPAARLLILLAKKVQNRLPSEWVTCSPLQLASTLRGIWSEHKSARGRVWLGLYIASVMRGVLGIQPNRFTEAEIESYLDEADLGGGRPMTSKIAKLPASSHELQFISSHVDDVYEILYD
jgi:hypothetical protein